MAFHSLIIITANQPIFCTPTFQYASQPTARDLFTKVPTIKQCVISRVHVFSWECQEP